MSIPENQTPVDPVAAAGATAQTSGFADAGASTSSSSAVPASASAAPVISGSTTTPSPVAQASTFAPSSTAALGSAGVPAFGYMGGAFGVTNYATGGMQSSPNVPAAGTSIDPSTGKPFSAGMTRAELEAKKAADISGREQAARQLAGPGLATGAPAVDTPGKELPGGWGPTPVLPPPGTSPQAPASIYEDVNSVLHKVGATAYAALPATLKDALSNNPEHLDKGKQPEGMPSSRRSSVAVLFDNAKKQTTEVINAIRDEKNWTPPSEKDPNRGSLKGGPEGRRTSSDQPTVFGQVKELFQEAYSGSAAPTKVTGLATAKTSMPSEEPLGARPGEHVSGVGALPGSSNETGVAVLPDEKVASTSGSTNENQGLLPGEVPTTAALSAPKTETDVATGSSATHTGLAPPLPQTVLGTGASEGATDINAVPGISSDHSANSSTLTAPGLNDRTDSFASTTAIRHGHAGEPKQSNSSPLATTTPAVATVDETPTPAGDAVPENPVEADTTSPLPVGAAPTTIAETTPAPATPSKTTGASSGSAIADSPGIKTTSLSKGQNGTSSSPVAKSSAVDDGHRRTGSASSNGKKKAGFMNKLKGEMKVISGKIGGDEAKVQAGERLKHGE